MAITNHNLYLSAPTNSSYGYQVARFRFQHHSEKGKVFIRTYCDQYGENEQEFNLHRGYMQNQYHWAISSFVKEEFDDIAKSMVTQEASESNDGDYNEFTARKIWNALASHGWSTDMGEVIGKNDERQLAFQAS